MSRVQANLLLLLTAMIWGSAFIAQQTGGSGAVGPLTFTATRFFLGGFVVLPFALRELAQRRRAGRRFAAVDFAGLVAVGFALFAGSVLQQAGIRTTTVTNAGFLTVLYVPLVPLIGLVLLRQLPHWSVWPAAAGCVAGTYLLSGATALSLGSGDFLVLVGAVFWAFHVLLVGAVGQRTGAPLTLACVQFFVVAVAGGIAAPIFETVSFAALREVWVEILYTGVLSSGLAFTFQVVGQRFTSAAEAAILLSSETLFAALGGALILSERLNPTQLFGCGLIFACICAVQILPLFAPKPRPAAADPVERRPAA